MFRYFASLLLVLTLLPTLPAAADEAVRVRIATTAGDIDLELYPEQTPATVANFLRYVDEGFYSGTIFHRVIAGFMIQGGGLSGKLEPKPTHDPVSNEADKGLTNEVGTIAMARTSDPHSATAQFFINTADNDFLNHSAPTLSGWGYAAFGRVVEGMAVVRKIEQSATGSFKGHRDVPKQPITITAVSRLDTP